MNMENLLADLKSDEGFKPTVYRDSRGFDTIGYGFLVDQRRKCGLPETIAEQWLEYEAGRKWIELATLAPWIEELPEPAQRALANMAYQLGANGVMRFRYMMAALAAGNFGRAYDEALASKWAEQTPQRAFRVATRLLGAK